jgi:uncharacterized protein YbaR (Trm112 family)
MTELDLLGMLCCPGRRADLELDVYSSDENGIDRELLLCSACGARYPIEDGLIYLLHEVRTAKEEGKPIRAL